LLPSFEVENFRTFSHLQIPHLGGVNLIVGRNNVGKTMLLEALRLYVCGGDPATIFDLLYERDELSPGRRPEDQQREKPFLLANTLFHGRLLRLHTVRLGETGTLTLRTGSTDPNSVRIEVRGFVRVGSAKEPGRLNIHQLVRIRWRMIRE